jgi:hypothetical protein
MLHAPHYAQSLQVNRIFLWFVLQHSLKLRLILFHHTIVLQHRDTVVD